MADIQNVAIYSDNAFANLIYMFPSGSTDDGENQLACSDQGNAGRPQQFATGTRYYIRYTIVGTGGQREWQGDCTYEAGGTAPVEFSELEMVE